MLTLLEYAIHIYRENIFLYIYKDYFYTEFFPEQQQQQKKILINMI